MERQNTTVVSRKRRTVLWLYMEDYEYLKEVAARDQETKNRSMHRLIRALRKAQMNSFRTLERLLPDKPAM